MGLTCGNITNKEGTTGLIQTELTRGTRCSWRDRRETGNTGEKEQDNVKKKNGHKRMKLQNKTRHQQTKEPKCDNVHHFSF